MADPASPAPNPRQVTLQRIYLKDCSLELPQAPQVFAKPWNPQLDVQVNTTVNGLGEQQFQVTLAVTVTAKLGEDTAFLAEVHQAGIFLITGFTSDAEIQAVLAGYCANTIFPFAREAIAELIQRGSFPPVLLQPINFEGLYLEHLARQQQKPAEAVPSGIILQ